MVRFICRETESFQVTENFHEMYSILHLALGIINTRSGLNMKFSTAKHRSCNFGAIALKFSIPSE
jgi:hypothetical protein